MTKLLLIDKDHTLVVPRNGKTFVETPWDQKPIVKTALAVQRYKSLDYEIAIISNQKGIMQGYKSLHDTFLEMRYCLELFPEIDCAYFCPDEGQTCWKCWDDCKEDCRIFYEEKSIEVWELNLEGKFRKPNPGMLQLAASHFGYSADSILYVGDRDEDFQAAEAMECNFMWRHEIAFN